MRSFSLTRRQTLKSLTAAGALLALGPGGCASPKRGVYYLHGVASGDPLKDRVILWTRAQPEDGQPISLIWEVATDESFEIIVSSGEIQTDQSTDFIAKVDATGLAAGTRYAFRFRTQDDVASPTGFTKTLPEGDVDQVRFAVFSCSNYPAGYFNAYKVAAERGDIDAAIHLGDYIYEYGNGGYATSRAEELGRMLEPATEIITLSDYRTRYGLYRMDADLQALHGAMPMFAVWDDHEITNDAWKHGAQNHNEDKGEGPYKERFAAALQAYLEWLPIRENTEDRARLYRQFDYGNLARLVMLDTRSIGRDRQYDIWKEAPSVTWPFDVSNPDAPVALAAGEEPGERPIKEIKVPFDFSTTPPTPLTDWAQVSALDPDNLPENHYFLPDVERFDREVRQAEDRELLGPDQSAFLASALEESRAAGQTWQLLGQQVLMGRVPAVNFLPFIDQSRLTNPYWKKRLSLSAVLADKKLPFSTDSWEGYPAARRRAYKGFTDGDAGNVVVLSGDTHNAWAFNLSDPTTEVPLGVEFGTSSVTSPGIESFLSTPAAKVAERFVANSPDLQWADLEHRGLMLVTLTAKEVRADWLFVDTIHSKDFHVRLGQTFTAQAGARQLDPNT